MTAPGSPARAAKCCIPTCQGATVELVTLAFVPLTKKFAEVLQSDLQSIGVQVAIQPLGAGEFNTRAQSRHIGGAWIARMTFTNLSPATFLLTSSNARIPNTSNFADPRYADLIAQATRATDDGALKSTLHDATRVMLDDPLFTTFAEGAGQLAGPEITRRQVANAHWDGFGLYAYRDVWLNG
jgi:ABC-type transport system substrate-binding protein